MAYEVGCVIYPYHAHSSVCPCLPLHTSLFSFSFVFAPRNGAVLFSVHTTPSLDGNGYLSIGVHICPEKRICLTASSILAFLLACSI